ncbi:hypothetical protein F0357_06615 [Rhizobiales bacterium Sp-1]|uniref:Uncharacterized protein n=1 Tax=Segnochrobactrum spirostomi TaxID=2608987 RepID=A0A6A7XZV2_9HYPH|nr:hypothetical protein [Segnochrobactrum spirostomi]
MLDERSNSYDRTTTLPRLLPHWPGDLADPGPDIVRRLERALRAERRKGRAGQAAYDLERHIALVHALAAERGQTRSARRPTP